MVMLTAVWWYEMAVAVKLVDTGPLLEQRQQEDRG